MSLDKSGEVVLCQFCYISCTGITHAPQSSSIAGGTATHLVSSASTRDTIVPYSLTTTLILPDLLLLNYILTLSVSVYIKFAYSGSRLKVLIRPLVNA